MLEGSGPKSQTQENQFIKKIPDGRSWSRPTFFQQAGACMASSLRGSGEIHCKWVPSQGTIPSHQQQP